MLKVLIGLLASASAGTSGTNQIAAPCSFAASISDQPLPQSSQPPARQDGKEEEEAQDDADEIVVAGTRARGSVDGDIPPERIFQPNDIRAFGVDNIEELLGALGPQVASVRGQVDALPITLLNGRRISSTAEIARIPAEAIERMEIFPEELALTYGYRPDQKVVNIVTFQRYRSAIIQSGIARPTSGGRWTGNAAADALLIRDNTRYGLGASYTRSGALLESERNVLQPVGETNLGRSRTLLPSSGQLVVNAVLGGPLWGDATGTLNGRVERNWSDSLLGSGMAGLLRRASDFDLTHVGATLGGRSGRWEWTALGNYDLSSGRTVTDLNGANVGQAIARSEESIATADLLVSGPLARLPAGPLSVTLRGGLELRDLDSRSEQMLSGMQSSIGRDAVSVQLNVNLPLFGEAGRGRLSANSNFALESLSDAGTLRTVGYGLNWTPSRAISILLSHTTQQRAPTLDQLGGPTLITPNVRTFDFARGEAVDITVVAGGNPLLRNEDRDVLRLGTTIRPLAQTDLTLNISYVASAFDGPITTFPIATPTLEAAFPDRFERDGNDRLLRIDTRSINFDRARQQLLRWGLNITRPLGSVPEGMEDGTIEIPASMASQMTPNPDGTFTFTPEPGSSIARDLATGASRMYVSFYHDWQLRDSLRLKSTLPVIDLLGGGAIDAAGGRGRHKVELVAGAAKDGLGGRVAATWRSGIQVDGATGENDSLRFADLVTVNFNLFVNVAERFGVGAATPWLKGTRLTFNVTNLINTRPRVRDRSGGTPLSYQSAYLDPLGRVVSLQLRKVFGAGS